MSCTGQPVRKRCLAISALRRSAQLNSHSQRQMPPAKPTVEMAYGALNGPITSVVICRSVSSLRSGSGGHETDQVEHHAPAGGPESPPGFDLALVHLSRELLSRCQGLLVRDHVFDVWIGQDISRVGRAKVVVEKPEPPRLMLPAEVLINKVTLPEPNLPGLTAHHTCRMIGAACWHGRRAPQ